MISPFSRIPAVLMAALLLAGCAAVPPADTDTPAETTPAVTAPAEPEVQVTDVFADALARSFFDGGMENLEAKAYGVGVFEDYLTIHANPATAAELPMQITAAAGEIGADTTGLSAFWGTLTADFAWKTNFSIGYKTAVTPEEALALLFDAAGDKTGLAAAQAAMGQLQESLRPAMADFLSAAAYAHSVYTKQTAKFSADQYAALAGYSFCPPATADPAPMQRVLDAAAVTDEAALLRAGFAVTRAAERLTLALAGCTSLTKAGEALSIETPAGRILLGTAGGDTYADASALLLIDAGGADSYGGKAAASWGQDRPVSVLIDLAGDDLYEASAEDGGAQGSGLLGAGILIDLAGDDEYRAVRCGQGFAMLGTGILFDGGGNDVYESHVSSQSYGVCGVSLLADAAGNDSYHAYAYAQASAGYRAVSILADQSGDDSYRVEPYAVAGYNGLLYGQFSGANGSWSQGCGAGNRSVTTPSLGVSGGIAGLIDRAGNDRYVGGIWAQGVGYWSGIGFLADTDGNDIYNAQYYSQASVAHFGVGVLVDIGGRDTHALTEGKVPSGEGAALGFTWDRGVAMLINDGGRDTYRVTTYSFGSSWSAYDDKGFAKQDMNYAFFLDTEGDDYYSSATEPAFGRGRGGIFLDLGGEDTYLHGESYNNRTLFGTVREGGVFIDREAGEGERFTASFWENAKQYLMNP